MTQEQKYQIILEALRFYALGSHYDHTDFGIVDHGQVARMALDDAMEAYSSDIYVGPV